MQGVAAKNDTSYDLSRARASVTGQTTIAASTTTTSLPNGRIVTALFAGALFLSTFLLFVLEPMVAKSILPTGSRDTTDRSSSSCRGGITRILDPKNQEGSLLLTLVCELLSKLLMHETLREPVQSKKRSTRVVSLSLV
jgi:hypothetical protein